MPQRQSSRVVPSKRSSQKVLRWRASSNRGDHLSALINGKREELLIVGIALSPEYIFAGLGGSPDQRSFGVFWLERRALATAYNMEGAFNQVAVRLAPGASEGVRSIWKEEHSITCTRPLAGGSRSRIGVPIFPPS